MRKLWSTSKSKMISISNHGNICEAAPQGARLPRTIFWVLNGFSESSEMRFASEMRFEFYFKLIGKLKMPLF